MFRMNGIHPSVRKRHIHAPLLPRRHGRIGAAMFRTNGIRPSIRKRHIHAPLLPRIHGTNS